MKRFRENSLEFQYKMCIQEILLTLYFKKIISEIFVKPIKRLLREILFSSYIKFFTFFIN